MLRSFAKKLVNVEGRSNGMSVYYIKCVECSHEEIIRAGKRSGSLHVTFVHKKFTSLGWGIGRNFNHDTCPECVSKNKFKYIQSKESIMSNVTPLSVKAEPPQPMTKEDRRIIFAKIDENYVDEMSGYSGDWNDEKVAKDLNVPRAWVSQIREDNFGPEIGEVVAQDVTLIQNEMEKARKLLADIDAAVAGMSAQYQSILQSLRLARASFSDSIKDATVRLEKLSKKR